MFVVDNSAQIADNSPPTLGPNWNRIRDFMVNIIEAIIPDGPLSGTRIGLILFSGTAENIFYVDRYFFRIF